MKKDDIKEKIEQFARGLDADCIVIVNPKDSDRFYSYLNGEVVDLVPMLFEVLRKMAKDSNMPLDGLFRAMADTLKDGENYGC
jgi:hypothetical protein